MKKKVGIIKRVLCIGLIFLLSINSFAAIVSDNDGSAFITKSEFDALKSSFQSQIDTYNQSIDSKIDGAIASYLAGIKLSTTQEFYIGFYDLWKDTPADITAQNFSTYDSDIGRNNAFDYILSITKINGSDGTMEGGEPVINAGVTNNSYFVAWASSGSAPVSIEERIVLNKSNRIKAWQKNNIKLNYSCAGGFAYTVNASGAYWFYWPKVAYLEDGVVTDIATTGQGHINGSYNSGVLSANKNTVTHRWTCSVTTGAATTGSFPSGTILAMAQTLSKITNFRYYWNITNGDLTESSTRNFNYIVKDSDDKKIYPNASESMQQHNHTSTSRFMRWQGQDPQPPTNVWTVSRLYDYEEITGDYTKLQNLQYQDMQTVLPWTYASIQRPLPLWTQITTNAVDFKFDVALDTNGYISMFYAEEDGTIKKMEIKNHESSMINVKKVNANTKTTIEASLPSKCIPLIAWNNTSWENAGIKLHYIDQTVIGTMVD